MAATVGIRELKNKLSAYIRRSEAGEIIEITAHGRTVARLAPPKRARRAVPGRMEALIASGTVRPPLESGSPTEGWIPLRLPPGTAAQLIDEDRGE